MKTIIHNIAVVNSGVYATSKPNGEVYYIQARDITEDHQLDKDLKPQLVADGKLDKHFLQAGDLLIAAKGRDHYAIEYKGYPSPAVASTIFIVVRLKDKSKLLPSFLQWYINLPPIQKSLSGGAQGSVLPVISKTDLERMEIQIPAIEKQTIILKIDELRQQEIQLTNQIELLKSKKIEQELFNALTN